MKLLDECMYEESFPLLWEEFSSHVCYEFIHTITYEEQCFENLGSSPFMTVFSSGATRGCHDRQSGQISRPMVWKNEAY
jgi:hypothetical protein